MTVVGVRADTPGCDNIYYAGAIISVSSSGSIEEGETGVGFVGQELTGVSTAWVTKIEMKSGTEAESVDEDDNGWKSGISTYTCAGAGATLTWVMKSEKGC